MINDITSAAESTAIVRTTVGWTEDSRNRWGTYCVSLIESDGQRYECATFLYDSRMENPMTQTREIDPLMGELFLAGEMVPPGAYREINGGRMVELEKADILPASLNGQVACYSRLMIPELILASHERPSDQRL